jgi:hypothetical protein
MTKQPPPPALVAGPYKTPRCRVGRDFPCVVHGDRPVRGLTDAPVPWPFGFAAKGKRQLFVSGGLERAVRTESVRAVVYHWGVSRSTVESWRRALGVERMTEGTTQLWVDLAPVRFGDPRRYRSGGKPPRKLSDAQVARIRRRAARGERAVVLAAENGVTRQYVGELVKGKARATEPLA